MQHFQGVLLHLTSLYSGMKNVKKTIFRRKFFLTQTNKLMKIFIHSRSKASNVSPTVTLMLQDFSKRDFSTDPYMTVQIDGLKHDHDLLKAAMNEKKAQSVLGPLDEKRDNLLRAILYLNLAKTFWPDERVKAAAEVVRKELDKYGFETIRLAYDEESASINALLDDLKKPEVVEAVRKLYGMELLINTLGEAQKEFEAAALEFVGIKIGESKLLSATKLTRKMIKQLNDDLLPYLVSMEKSKPDLYKDCAEVIRAIIENNNSKVRNRAGGSDEDSHEE